MNQRLISFFLVFRFLMFVGSVYNRYNKDKIGYKDVCMWLVCGLINDLIGCNSKD